jgi:hypothetical protein
MVATQKHWVLEGTAVSASPSFGAPAGTAAVRDSVQGVVWAADERMDYHLGCVLWKSGSNVVEHGPRDGTG